MLLVAYLRMLDSQHRSLGSASQGLLYPMIHSSDNAAASAVLAIVGESALTRGARRLVGFFPGRGSRPGALLLSPGRADPAPVRRLRPLAGVDDRTERELG